MRNYKQMKKKTNTRYETLQTAATVYYSAILTQRQRSLASVFSSLLLLLLLLLSRLFHSAVSLSSFRFIYHSERLFVDLYGDHRPTTILFIWYCVYVKELIWMPIPKLVSTRHKNKEYFSCAITLTDLLIHPEYEQFYRRYFSIFVWHHFRHNFFWIFVIYLFRVSLSF